MVYIDVGGALQAEILGLPGTELRERIQRKYGRTYDLSIVRRRLAGRTIVAMNVMVRADPSLKARVRLHSHVGSCAESPFVVHC
jgi:hypothetical protein